MMMKNVMTLGLLASSALLTGCGFQVVGTGERGVVTNFGKIEEVVGEGFHLYNPATEDLITMTVRVLRQDGAAMAYTKDVQQVTVKFAATYNLDASKVAEVYQAVGTNWENRFVEPVLYASIKEVIGQYEAVELVSKRGQATMQITERLSGAMKKNGINLTDFNLVNIDFNDEYERAVEAKVTAVQNAERAVNETVRIKEEAAQKIISAKAEAESMEIRTRALSQNNALVAYEAVQKWNGVLPVYMLGDSVPLLNVGK